MTDLRIGRTATLAGVSIDTVRFYERRGLLPRARRETSGYRVFDETTVERLRLIRALGDLGLGLDEIAAMLEALTNAGAQCSDERHRLAGALERTEARIAELRGVRDALRAAIARCDAGACEIPGRALEAAPRVRRPG